MVSTKFNRHQHQNSRQQLLISRFLANRSFLFPNITRTKLILLSISILVCVRLMTLVSIMTVDINSDDSTNNKMLRSSTNNNKQAQGLYRGIQYWKDGVTQKVQTLYETKFARFQVHQIKIENGDTQAPPKIIYDWMWFDESDNINVLVETSTSDDDEEEGPKYIVLEQTKYGIQGLTYAVVGGLIELNEEPIVAAKRELKEELGMVASEWTDLGNYRAAANRGGGTTYSFLARNAVKDLTSTNAQNMDKDDAGTHIAVGELERQDMIYLTRSQLQQAVLDGKFKEIKWAATVALALLKTTN